MTDEMRERLGPTGVGRPGPGLNDEVLEHLRNVVTSKELPDDSDVDGFLEFTNGSVSRYWSSKTLQEDNQPSRVKKELQDANASLVRFSKKINNLGGTSKWFLHSSLNCKSEYSFNSALDVVRSELLRAERMASNPVQMRGAPRSHHRRSLASEVAYAMSNFLGMEPTTTRGGLFEEIVILLLEAIEEREVKSVREILSAALKKPLQIAPIIK